MKTRRVGSGLVFWCSVLILILATPLFAEVRFSTTPVEVPASCQAYACGDNVDACKVCHLITDTPPGDTTAGPQPQMSMSIFMTAASSPTTTVTSPDGKFTVTYPPTVAVGESFTNEVTVNGYAMTYDYFVDNVWNYGTWPWGWLDRTYTHDHTFDAPAPHIFSARVLYCNGGYDICAHGWLRTEISWDVVVGTPLLGIDNVPYYNQGPFSCDEWYGSLHPEQTRKPEPCIGGGPWASDEYDGTPPIDNVAKKGCAITSAVMVLRKLGIDNVCYDNTTYVPCSDNVAFNNPANWHDVNPGTLNEWASKNDDAYDGTGGFIFKSAERYSNKRVKYSVEPSRNDDVLNSLLGKNIPAILRVKSAPWHFVVATGQKETGASPNWFLHDPGYFEVDDLRDRGRNGIYYGMRIYRPSTPDANHGSIEIRLGSPAEILVIDPSGRRTGYDSSSGSDLHEIPSSAYFLDGIDDDLSGETEPEVRTLFIDEPIDGLYRIQVIGTGTGEFWIKFLSNDRTGDVSHQTMNGTIGSQKRYDYELDYSSDPDFPSVVMPRTYEFLGFMPPVRIDGSSVFKQGSTIPIKFQLKDRSGHFAADVTARLVLQKFSDGVPVGEPIDATPAGGSDSGNIFRYDVTANQYVYNLKTGGFSAGTWKVIVFLEDGSSYDVPIGIR
ncbi:MAG: hypothetical protein Kow00128_02910 [Deltaproteobacteria bacterium]